MQLMPLECHSTTCMGSSEETNAKSVVSNMWQPRGHSQKKNSPRIFANSICLAQTAALLFFLPRRQLQHIRQIVHVALQCKQDGWPSIGQRPPCLLLCQASSGVPYGKKQSKKCCRICCCFVFACVSTSLGACLLLHLVSTVSTFTSCFMKHCVSYFMVSEPNMQASAQPKVPNQKCCQKYPQSVLWKCPTQSTQSVVKVPTPKYPKCCESVNPKYPKCCESANPKYPKCCKSTKPKCSKCHGATEWCRSLGRNFYQTTTKLLPYIFS